MPFPRGAKGSAKASSKGSAGRDAEQDLAVCGLCLQSVEDEEHIVGAAPGDRCWHEVWLHLPRPPPPACPPRPLRVGCLPLATRPRRRHLQCVRHARLPCGAYSCTLTSRATFFQRRCCLVGSRPLSNAFRSSRLPAPTRLLASSFQECTRQFVFRELKAVKDRRVQDRGQVKTFSSGTHSSFVKLIYDRRIKDDAAPPPAQPLALCQLRALAIADVGHQPSREGVCAQQPHPAAPAALPRPARLRRRRLLGCAASGL